MASLEGLIEAYVRCVEGNKSTCRKLRSKVREVEAFKSKCLAAKTVGTVIGTVGTAAGIGFAFFTGGLSVLAVSAVSAVASAGTSLITALIDKSETKDFIREIEALNTSRKDDMDHLNNLLGQVSEMIREFQETGVDENEAFCATFVAMGLNNPGRVSRRYKKATKTEVIRVTRTLLKSGRIYTATRPLYSILGLIVSRLLVIETFNSAPSLNSLCYSLLLNEHHTRTAIGSALRATPSLGSILTIARTGAKSGAKGAGKGLGLIAGPIFVAVDIGLLIADFVMEHAAVEYGNKVIAEIEAETTKMEESVQSIRNIEEIVEDEEEEEEEECSCVESKIDVLFMNAQSIRPTRTNEEKSRAIKSLVESRQPHIFALVETWLTPGDSTEVVAIKLGIDGYDIHRWDRADNETDGGDFHEMTGRQGGGMLVAWKKDFTRRHSFSHSALLNENRVFQDTFQYFYLSRKFDCRACSPTIVKNYIFCVVYRRQNRLGETSRLPAEGRDDFLLYKDIFEVNITRVLRNWTSLLCGGGFPVVGAVGVGDFNWTANKLDSVLRRQNVSGIGRVSNDSATHRTGTSPDMVLASPGLVSSVETLIRITDHAPLFFSLTLGKDYNPTIGSCEACD